MTLENIRKNDHVLTPGRYVGSENVEDDGEALDLKIARLSSDVREGFSNRAILEARVLASLDSLKVATDE